MSALFKEASWKTCDYSAYISLAKFSYGATLICECVQEIHLTQQKYMQFKIKFLFLKGRAEWIWRQAASILCLKDEDIFLLDCFKGQ